MNDYYLPKEGEDGPLLAEGVEKSGAKPLEVGDLVTLKGTSSPRMVINEVSHGMALVRCAFWHDAKGEFEFVQFHRDTLKLDGSAAQRNHTLRAPATTTRTVLETAIRNGRHLCMNRSMDHSLMYDCFDVLTAELYQHVDIARQP